MYTILQEIQLLSLKPLWRGGVVVVRGGQGKESKMVLAAQYWLQTLSLLLIGSGSIRVSNRAHAHASPLCGMQPALPHIAVGQLGSTGSKEKPEESGNERWAGERLRIWFHLAPHHSAKQQGQQFKSQRDQDLLMWRLSPASILAPASFLKHCCPAGWQFKSWQHP